MPDTAKLTHGSIAGHLWRQTSPIVLGVAAIMSVGIIDAYFVGQLGQRQLAAISFIFPVTTALSSLGVGVIAGVSSVVSRALGEGDEEKARQRGNLGIFVGLGVGLAVAALLLVLRKPLFRLMQASDAQLPLIDSYMRSFALGFPLLLVLMGINGAMRGQGAAVRSTIILVTFSGANWFLDPLLINGGLGLPGFGFDGAAYATVAGWALGVIVAVPLLRSTAIGFHPAAALHRGWQRGVAALARVAGPAAFSNAINPAGLAILTSLLAAEGEAAVAGFGAGGRLETFAVVPLLALSSSIGAIVGQNWGAGEIGRARRALLLANGFCLAYGLAAAAVLFFARHFFAARFGSDPATRDQTAQYLAIAVWGYAGYGVLIVVNGALNAIDRAGKALALSLGRVLLVMIPVAWLLRGPMGAPAIYLAELACNVAGFVAAGLLAWRVFAAHDRRGKGLPGAATS